MPNRRARKARAQDAGKETLGALERDRKAIQEGLETAAPHVVSGSSSGDGGGASVSPPPLPVTQHTETAATIRDQELTSSEGAATAQSVEAPSQTGRAEASTPVIATGAPLDQAGGLDSHGSVGSTETDVEQLRTALRVSQEQTAMHALRCEQQDAAIKDLRATNQELKEALAAANQVAAATQSQLEQGKVQTRILEMDILEAKHLIAALKKELQDDRTAYEALSAGSAVLCRRY